MNATTRSAPKLSGRAARELPEPLPASSEDGILRQSDCPELPRINPGHSFIYQLVDPVTRTPRYVGVTRAPRHRLAVHKFDAKQRGASVYEWWRQMLDTCGHAPVMRIIEGPIRDTPQRRAPERAERAWELAHLNAGVELFNHEPAGKRRTLRAGPRAPGYVGRLERPAQA